MPLKLHDKCIERLISQTTEVLKVVMVVKGDLVDGSSFSDFFFQLENILQKKGKDWEDIEENLGEHPFWDFLIESLALSVKHSQKRDRDLEPRLLTTIEGYKNPEETARRVVNEFSSLPWEYSLTIPFNNDFGKLYAKSCKTYHFSDSIKLIVPDEDFIRKYPCTLEVECTDCLLLSPISVMKQVPALFPPNPPGWNMHTSYLQVKVKGFIGDLRENIAFSKAISQLKSICGLGTAINLFGKKSDYYLPPLPINFVVHRMIDDKWRLERLRDIDTSIANTIYNINLNECLADEDQETVLSLIEEKVADIACVFKSGIKGQKLLHACEWFFDSNCTKNKSLAFIQATIAIEILLGDKAESDQMGLGALLRNRCAYLVGRSHSEREEIFKDLAKIYEVRCAIVHRGKIRLNHNERILFQKLHLLCRRIIQEEVLLLVEDDN